MNFKNLYLGILTVVLTISIMGQTYHTAIAQSANNTQGNATYANQTQTNMTQQNLSTEETIQLSKENSPIESEDQENKDDTNDNGN